MLASLESIASPAPDGVRPGVALSSREREVLTFIAKGFSCREIAGFLGLSAKTVDCHRTNVTRKLGIHRPAHLVVYAMQHGMIPVPHLVGRDTPHGAGQPTEAKP